MKKFSKTILSLVLVVSMIISLGMTTFAENPGTISSHVEFEVTDAGVSAKAFYRDLGMKYKYDAEAGEYSTEIAGKWGQLIFAAYDKDGRITGVAIDTGLNRVLRTEPVAVPEDGSAKAFVWESASKVVVSEIAVYKAADYDFEDVLDTLEITFDGESFESFVGTPFNKTTTTYNAGTITSVPGIKATVKDNATYVTAYSTESAYIVEVKSTTVMDEDITFSGVQTGRINGTNTTTAIRPNYVYSKKYTINYTIAAAKAEKINPAKEFIYMANSETRWPNQAGAMMTSALPGPTNHEEKNVASATVTVTDEPVEVAVTINKDINQNTFIVVRPATGANSPDNQVIVQPDGSAISKIDDWEANKSYTVAEDGTVTLVPYKRSSASVAPVTFTPASGDPIDLWVGYDLGDSRTEGDNGANISNRAPKLETLHLGKGNDTIKNAEWIPSDVASTVSGGGTFTFKVGQSAIIDVYARDFTNADVTVTADGEAISTTDKSATETVWVVGTLIEVYKANIRDDYKPYFDLTLAYFDHMGYINGVHYIYDEVNQKLSPYDCIKPDGANNPNQNGLYGFGSWGFISLAANGNHNGGMITNTMTLDYYVNPMTDSRFWVNGVVGGTMKTREELADLFEDDYVWPVAPKHALPASNLTFAQTNAEFAEKIGGTPAEEAWCKTDIVTFVPGTTADSIFQLTHDNDGASHNRFSNKVSEYNTLLEIEGAAVVRAAVAWSNGNTAQKSGVTPLMYGLQAAADQVGVECTMDTPFYTIDIKEDSEVIVVTPHGTSYGRTPVNANAGWLWPSEQFYDAIACQGTPAGGFYNAATSTAGYKWNTNIAFKYVEGGTTLTINVPEGGVRPVVFVRPL